jgi:hypothetical protein
VLSEQNLLIKPEKENIVSALGCDICALSGSISLMIFIVCPQLVLATKTGGKDNVRFFSKW